MECIDKQTAPAVQWEAAPRQPWLGVDDVQIWRAQLVESCTMPLLRDTLSLRESLKAERFAHHDERREFVATRGFLRHVLARYAAVQPDEVTLDENDGAMRLPSPYDDLRFDAAFNGGLLIVAAARSHAVGVGLERVRENLPFTEIAAHFLEPEQSWSVISSRGAERTDRFFAGWTREEALQRAGLLQARRKLEVHHFSPSAGFSAALACSASEPRLAFWDWTL
jgi:4'-phosphopantetheinyl transferase